MELQAYIDRERILLSELAAARAQVDKLLDMQQMLLGMVARLPGLAEPISPQLQAASLSGDAAQAALRPQLPQLPASAPAASHPGNIRGISTSTAAPGAPASPASGAAPKPSALGSTSPDVPALTSLTELFRSAAASAPHPATAAAAASIAAAVAAVEGGRDILAISDFDIPTAAVAADAARPLPPTPSGPAALLPQPSLIFDTLSGFVTGSAAASVGATLSSEEEGAEEPAAAGATTGMPVEVAKAAPTDPPPELVQGDDDIFWLSRLHSALEQQGFFPGDDDMENWFFGEGTLAAVLAFQASSRLPETGVVDRPTWTALLGEAAAAEMYGRATAVAAAAELSSDSEAMVTAVPVVAEVQITSSSGSRIDAAALQPSSSSSSPTSSSGRGSGAPPGDLTRWPVLREGDGGREVHALQVALANHGFHCGEDDMRWWQFGDATLTALKYFQSCNSLPESGVCDERCWRALLGPEAAPSDLRSLRLSAANSDDEDGGFEDDMEGISQGRVWLLGEQRWERRAGP